MELSPKSIENVGGFMFHYKIENSPTDYCLHRLGLDVKNKALKEELQPIFDKFPHPLKSDTLELQVDEFRKFGGGIFFVNNHWLELLKYENWFVRGEENLPIFTKLAELTKLIARSQDEFKISGGFLDENIQKYNLRTSGMINFADDENGLSVKDRFVKTVKIPKVYDFLNAKKVAASFNNVIQKEMNHFFDVG
ncbi:MAG: hypothetical protein WCY19_04845 [Candidatus Gastranaerophilaceae bacterium]